jgi:hypothetical protein
MAELKPSDDPTVYNRKCAGDAEKLRLIGATRAELCLFFGVDRATLERWAEDHKDFERALQVAPSIFGVTHEDFGLFNWLKDYRLGNLN